MSRLCACGCKCSLEGKRRNARYASAACRTLDWKNRHGIVGIRYVKASQNEWDGGLQSAFGSVRRQMKLLLILTAPSLGPEKIDALVDYHAAATLPERQRARLQTRQKKAA